MGDAAECHLCHYEFDRRRVQVYNPPALPSDQGVAEDLDTCERCGERYRRGLLRCPNCGSFTRPEIEEEYRRRSELLARMMPEGIELPEYVEQRTGAREIESLDELSVSQSGTTAGDDEDFELTAEDADFDFELSADVSLQAIPAESTFESSPFTAPASIPPEDQGGYPLRLERPVAQSESMKPQVSAWVETQHEAHDKDTQRASAAPKHQPPSDHTRDQTNQQAIQPREVSSKQLEDELLAIARQEEAEIRQSRMEYRQKIKGGFIVYCPLGCKIRVKEQHRGKRGKCPRCGSLFYVPVHLGKKPPAEVPPDHTSENETAPKPGIFGKWHHWMTDVHCHVVQPQKLKIKPDSLLKDYQAVDLAFSEEGLLVMWLASSGGGLFGGNLAKKIPAARQASQQHLQQGLSWDKLPVANKRLYATESLSSLTLVQPSPPDVDSLFGGIPIFGAYRIAVKLPRQGDESNVHYLSFSLSEFRQFLQGLSQAGGPQELGRNTEIPWHDEHREYKCHYTEQKVLELLGLGYYQQDRNFNLSLSGWRCASCGLVVSEDARKKEKIGGLNGKGIAKATCPKCKRKFGHQPLYELKENSAATAASNTP